MEIRREERKLRIPVFRLGEGQTSLPSFDREQARALAYVILMDEAKRPTPSPRGGHPKEPMKGEFVSYAGKCTWHRSSDRVERIYAAVELLKHAGASEKEACLEVAEQLGPRIGNSNRGRPPKGLVPQDILRGAEIVRKLSYNFRARHPWKEKLPDHDPIVEKWYAHALGIARWSQEMVRPCEGVDRHPILDKFRQTAQKIFLSAEELRDLWQEFPKQVPGNSSDRVFPKDCVPILPKGWRPSGYLSPKNP